MPVNEIIGWMATVTTMLSFLFQNMIYLRTINFVACVIWVIYGFRMSMNPVIVTNAIIGCIHLFWLYKNKNKLKEN